MHKQPFGADKEKVDKLLAQGKDGQTPRGSKHNRHGSVKFKEGNRRSRGGRHYSKGGTRARTLSRSPGGRQRIGAAKNGSDH